MIPTRTQKKNLDVRKDPEKDPRVAQKRCAHGNLTPNSFLKYVSPASGSFQARPPTVLLRPQTCWKIGARTRHSVSWGFAPYSHKVYSIGIICNVCRDLRRLSPQHPSVRRYRDIPISQLVLVTAPRKGGITTVAISNSYSSSASLSLVFPSDPHSMILHLLYRPLSLSKGLVLSISSPISGWIQPITVCCTHGLPGSLDPPLPCPCHLPSVGDPQLGQKPSQGEEKT